MDSAERLTNLFKCETKVRETKQVEIWKAYSTNDGKEAFIHTIRVGSWKPEVVDCFLNALKIVENYDSNQLLLQCFAHERNLENQTISYVTESILDNVKNVLAGIGSVRLGLVRKLFQDILIGLRELHSQTDKHAVLIHGRIRLHHMMYFRSTGEVRLGGYFWLTEARPDSTTPLSPIPPCNDRYPQAQWALEDDYLGYYPREVLESGQWSPAVDIYALGMCFIHLLSGCQPYGELDDASFIKSAILSNKPPAGLLRIQQIDAALFSLLQRCLAPWPTRPTAGELLNDPFFADGSSPVIDLVTPLVENHVNSNDRKCPFFADPPPDPAVLFSRAFLAPLGPAREHAAGIRFDSPPDFISLGKQRDSPRELEDSVGVGVSATQDSTESEVVHIWPKVCPITPSLSEESVRTKLNLQRNASARRNPLYYPLLLSQATLTMKLPASLVIPSANGVNRGPDVQNGVNGVNGVNEDMNGNRAQNVRNAINRVNRVNKGSDVPNVPNASNAPNVSNVSNTHIGSTHPVEPAGMIRLKQKVRFLELEQPWNSIAELEGVLNDLRASRGNPNLSEKERSELAAGVLAALNLAGKEIRQRAEFAGKSSSSQCVSLFHYLCSLVDPVGISLCIPAVFINDDPNCEFVDRVDFQLPREFDNLEECVETVARRLADAVNELRAKNDLPALSSPRESRLIDEVRGVLLFHLGQLVDLQADQRCIFTEPITAVITHYQTIQKSALLSSRNSITRSTPLRTSAGNLTLSPFRSSGIIGTDSFDDLGPIKEYSGDPIPSNSLAHISIHVPIVPFSRCEGSPELTIPVTCDIRKPHFSAEIAMQVMEWLKVVHPIGCRHLALQKAIGDALLGELEKVKVISISEEPPKPPKKSRDELGLEVNLTKLNEEMYTAYCQITVKKDGTDSVFTVKETHKFDEGICAAVNTQYELIKHIRGVIVESDSDLKDRLKEEFRRELLKIRPESV